MRHWYHGYGVRCALAAAAGLLLAAAFPKPGWAGMAWIAPGLMLFSATGFRGRQAFGIGYAAGLGFWLATLYWILYIPFPGGAVAGWLALSAYIALYQATWVWLCGWWHDRPGPPASLTVSGPADTANEAIGADSPGVSASDLPGLPRGRGDTCPSLFRHPVLWPLLCATLWVALEMIRARLFSGFPWSPLGVSQYQMVPLVQLAAWTGVYGLSFLIVWFSASLLVAGGAVYKQPTHRYAWLGPIALPLMAVLIATAAGTTAVLRAPAPARFLQVALVQPSIPQTLIWDPKENTNRFLKMIELSETALASRPQLLIWPESSVPDGSADLVDLIRREIVRLVQKHKVWLIFGAGDAELRQPPKHPDDYAFFNASILASPEGRFVATYRKQQLVIFGEYVPLVRWLPFMKWFTPVGEGFASGTRPVPFHLPDLGVTASVLICFEDVFPHLARHYAQPDTDFLVNITNDGWFGETAAQWQQAANAVFRAVENHIPLVRCANNGLTCWIDAQGRLHEVYFPDSKDIYSMGFKTASIPLLAKGETRTPTCYRRYGDWFGWTCVAVSVVAGLLTWRRQDRGEALR